MKKTVKPLALALIAAALLALTACGEAAPDETYRVWFVAKSTDTEFWKAAFAGANAAKSEYNVELTICGPRTEEDYLTQNRYVEDAVKAGADALIFSSISYVENAAAIDAAAESGVKVVVIDSDVASSRVSARIGTDNVQAGRMAASAALDSPQERLTVGIVNYDLGSRNGQEREQGFRELLGDSGRVEQIHTINVLAEVEDAREGTLRLLREHPQINVIAAFNEPLSVGAALAVEELGAGERVRMVGFDTNIICADLMRTGSVAALIVQNPYGMGYLGVETAWKLLQGVSFDPNKLIDTSTLVVSKENMFAPECQKALFPFG